MARRQRRLGATSEVSIERQGDLFRDRPRFFPPIPIDREPILADWRARCVRLVSELSETADRLRAFEEEAIPAYRAWISREFGSELTACRELAESLAAAETVHRATEAEALTRGRGFPAAYQAVMARKRAGENLFPSDFDRAFDDEGWEEGWSEVDPFGDYGSSADNDEKPDLDKSDEPRASRPTAGTQETQEAPADDAVRILYRKLAFALHPDVNPDLSPRQRQLWNEVQFAYTARDAARLELLLAWSGLTEDPGFERITHVSTLKAFFEDRLRELREKTSAFHRLRKDPAWRFWIAREKAAALDSLRLEVESELISEFLRLRRKTEHYDGLFRKWATGTSRRSR